MRIAIFSLIEWDFVNQRPQAFARELAKLGHEVLYVEPPAIVGDPAEWFEQRRAGKVGIYEAEAGVRVAEGTMILYRDGHRDFFSWNADLTSATTRWLAPFNLDFAILLAPEYAPALDPLGIPYAYDHVDDTQFMPGVDTDAYLRALEYIHARSAFNVYIQEPAAERDPKGFFLPNGVDVGVFFPIERPKLFDGVVLSTIAQWFDMDSILQSASPILLIGPMDHDLGNNRKRMFGAGRPNLHWIPQVDKPTANLWLSAARAGIVPFKVTHPVIPYAMPVKILEYFMAGLPVVTYRSEGIERFYGDRVTYYSPDGSTDPDLDEAIARATVSRADNHAFALQYRWENLVRQLEQRIVEEIRRQPRRKREATPTVAPTFTGPASTNDASGHTSMGVPTAAAEPADGASGRPDGAQRRYIAALQRQLQERTAWAVNLDRECKERTEWAQRLERQLEAKSKWAQALQREVEALTGRVVEEQMSESEAPRMAKSDQIKEMARELSFIRQQWWFKAFSPGWRGWLGRVRSRPGDNGATRSHVGANEGWPGGSSIDQRPFVSLIVLNWNGIKYLPGCFDSLRAQTYRNFEVIMVDNGSTDGSVGFIRTTFPEVRIIQNARNLGFAAGNNIGIAQARGDLIGLVNNDVEAAPTWLEELVRAIQGSDRIAGVCGTICALGDPERVIFTLTKIDPESARAYWIKQISPARSVDYLAGNSMIVRRSVIEEIGGLDDAYFAYFEDTDWGARMIRAGCELRYVPTARIAHQEMGTSTPDWHYHLMIRNRLRFALKNFDVAFLPRFFASFVKDMREEYAANLADGSPQRNRLVRIAVLWNFKHLPETLIARLNDRRRMRTVRSYNESLPLREIRCDGLGGYVDDGGQSLGDTLIPRPQARPESGPC